MCFFSFKFLLPATELQLANNVARNLQQKYCHSLFLAVPKVELLLVADAVERGCGIGPAGRIGGGGSILAKSYVILLKPSLLMPEVP